jgi:hypothetical protein
MILKSGHGAQPIDKGGIFSMKKRLSFVTNSSSCAYIVVGKEITREEAEACDFDNVAAIMDDGDGCPYPNEDYSNDDEWKDCTVDQFIKYIKCTTFDYTATLDLGKLFPELSLEEIKEYKVFLYRTGC